MKTLFDKLPFLSSTRFWAIVMIGVSMLLHDAHVISQSLADFVFVVCSGHIGIRTIDRFAEKAKE